MNADRNKNVWFGDVIADYVKGTRMSADERGFEQGQDRPRAALKHGELTERILRVFFGVYNELGYGFLESVYEAAMEVALRAEGIACRRQVRVPVHFRGQVIGEFVPDMIVEELILIEFKAARVIDASHEAQTLNGLKATEYEVGLLLNFGPKPEFRRFVFENERKRPTHRT